MRRSRAGAKQYTPTNTDLPRRSSADSLIILHGSGGLESRNFPYARLAASLASRGIYVRVPHYFDAVRPKAGKVESQYGAWVEVVRSAIGKHGGAALIGFSLGASIALAAAAADSRIAAVIDCAGSMPDEYFLHLKQLPAVSIPHDRGDRVKARRYDCRTRIGDGSFHGLPAPESESIDQIVRFVLTRAN